jgi:hypothetical protein
LVPSEYETIPIPNNGTWIVTMWHFGYDSPTEYTGPRFCATWRDGQNALARAYSKDIKSGVILRNELQQYPQKRWDNIVTHSNNKLVEKICKERAFEISSEIYNRLTEGLTDVAISTAAGLGRYP